MSNEGKHSNKEINFRFKLYRILQMIQKSKLGGMVSLKTKTKTKPALGNPIFLRSLPVKKEL